METVFTAFLSITSTLLILLLPIRGARRFRPTRPGGRFHEADAVLSRRLLNPGSGEYLDYYGKHPEFKEWDDRSRQSPGLLSEGSRHYHPGTFSASRANFHRLTKLQHLTCETPKLRRVPSDPRRMSMFIHRCVKKSRAHSIGITRWGIKIICFYATLQLYSTT